jgi:hypothetical protein
MGMNDIESACLDAEDLLLHEYQWHITINHLRLRSKRLRAGGPEAGQCLRIPACKEGDVMTLANQFFRKVRDDSLRASV